MAEDCLTSAESKLSSLSLADQDAVSCHKCNSDEYDSSCKNCCSMLESKKEEEKSDHVKETCYSDSEDDSGGNFEDTDEQIHKATEGATAPSTDDEYHSADEGEIHVDEELLKKMEETLSDEEKKVQKLLLLSPYLFVDVFYVHEPPSEDNCCEQIFDQLCSLDVKGQSYIFEVSKNLTKLYDSMAQLLAHPLQRPLQKDSSHRIRANMEEG